MPPSTASGTSTVHLAVDLRDIERGACSAMDSTVETGYPVVTGATVLRVDTRAAVDEPVPESVMPAWTFTSSRIIGSPAKGPIVQARTCASAASAGAKP